MNVTWNSSTYPEDIWGHFTHGTTGTGTPPYGALVFFNDPSNITDSHVMISIGGGNNVSTSDAFATGIHYESMRQEANSGAYATYVGWWLPDG